MGQVKVKVHDTTGEGGRGTPDHPLPRQSSDSRKKESRATQTESWRWLGFMVGMEWVEMGCVRMTDCARERGRRRDRQTDKHTERRRDRQRERVRQTHRQTEAERRTQRQR